MNKRPERDSRNLAGASSFLMYITGDKEEFFKTVKEELAINGWGRLAQGCAAALIVTPCFLPNHQGR